MMDWYKSFHGMPYDPQLAVVAKRAGVSRAEALAVWVALLDHASQGNPRGSLERLDAEKLAVALDIDPPRIEAALQALRDKGLIGADNAIEGWQARQGTSTDRVRRHRGKVRAGSAPREDAPAAIAARHARLRAHGQHKR